MFLWGYNEFGQLGLGDNQNSRSLPTRLKTLPCNKQIASIYCGYNHSAALLGFFTLFFYLFHSSKDSGELYIWGINGYGQLGLGDRENRNSPQQVGFFFGKKIVSVFCDVSHHCAALLGANLHVIALHILRYG